MKPKLILRLALVLSSGLFGCATNNTVRPDAPHPGEPMPVPIQGELTWPAVAAGQWEWTPRIVYERFKQASTNALGSADDIIEINQSIAANDLRHKLRVTDLRWLSPTLAMARVSGGMIRFDYVVEKKNGRWTVLVYYTYMIFD